jgi:hypothetical protein
MILSEPDYVRALMDELSGLRSRRVSSGRKETKIAQLGGREIRDGHTEQAQRKSFWVWKWGRTMIEEAPRKC